MDRTFEDYAEFETRRLLLFLHNMMVLSPEEKKTIRRVLDERINELDINGLCCLIKNTPFGEREKYVAILDNMITPVGFHNYEAINKVDHRYYVNGEGIQLIASKVTAFFNEVLNRDHLLYEQLVLLAGTGTHRFERIFRDLIKQRGLHTSEMKELLSRWPNISKFWFGLLKEELVTLNQRFSSAIDREDFGDIRKIIEILSKTNDK